jgi:hypothetical protein
MQAMVMTAIPVAAFAAWVACLVRNMFGNNRHESQIIKE